MKSNYLILKVEELNWSVPGSGEWKKVVKRVVTI